MLKAVFAAVAPGSLWPVDVLLRVLFSSLDQVRKLFYKVMHGAKSWRVLVNQVLLSCSVKQIYLLLKGCFNK